MYFLLLLSHHKLNAHTTYSILYFFLICEGKESFGSWSVTQSIRGHVL